MAFTVRYLKNPPEGYKTVRANKEGEVQKYKMKSIKNSPIEYPNSSVIQSVTKRFMTQRNLEPIYSSVYGVDWAKFVGRDMTPELVMDIEQEITDAMSVCKFVESVDVEVSGVDLDKVLINCKVTIKGEYTVSKKSETTFLSTELTV